MKHVVHLPRAGGKTTRIVELVKQTPGGIFVAHNKSYADLVRRQFDLREDQVMSWRQVMEAKRGLKNPKFFMDDADYVLAQIFGTRFTGISVNMDCVRCRVQDGLEPL